MNHWPARAGFMSAMRAACNRAHSVKQSTSCFNISRSFSPPKTVRTLRESLARHAATHRRKHPRLWHRRQPSQSHRRAGARDGSPRRPRPASAMDSRWRTPMPGTRLDGRESSRVVCAPCRSIAFSAPGPRHNPSTTTPSGGSSTTRPRTRTVSIPKAALPELRSEFAPQIEAYATILRNLHGADATVRGGLYYPRMALFDWWEL